MVLTPDVMAPRYVEAGCRRLIVHAEACPHLHRTLGAIRELGATAGVALNPATPPSAVAHVLDLVELVLVMTVNPGWGGQQYIASMEPKIAEVRRMVTRPGSATRSTSRSTAASARRRSARPQLPAPTSSSPAARCTRTPRASSTPWSTCAGGPPRRDAVKNAGTQHGRAAVHADPQRLRERRHRRQRPRTAQRRRAGERPAGRVLRAAPPTGAARAGVARGPPGRHGPDAPTLLLLGHTDVVPVNPAGWTRDPFGGELVDGEVWGRGAVDMLNQTSGMALAFAELAAGPRLRDRSCSRRPPTRRPAATTACCTCWSTNPTCCAATSRSPRRAAR